MSRWSVRVAAVLLGACVPLLLAEIGLRIWLPHVRESALPGRLLAISDDLGWSFRSSTTARHRSRYFDVEYHINSMGFRDAPRTERRGVRPYRLVLYGDSMVFGWGIPAQARFSNLLEDDGRALEAWNHATPGYGLDQQILLYEREAHAIDVDEVVFFVSTSTIERLYSGKIYAKYKPRFVLEHDGRVRLVPVPRFRNRAVSTAYRLLSPFYLPYFLQVRVARARAAVMPRVLRASGDPPVPARYVGPFELALMRRAIAVTRAAHHRMALLVANLPQADRLALRTFCTDNDIGYLEIDSALTIEAYTDQSSGLVLGRDDLHWNARAHGMIADSLKRQLGAGNRTDP